MSKQTIKLTTGLRTKNLMTKSVSIPFIPSNKKLVNSDKEVILPDNGLDSKQYKIGQILL